MTPEERRARLRQRTVESAADRGQRGLGKGLKLPFDLSKAGKEVVWYELTADPRVSNMIDIIPFEVTRPEYASMRQFSGKPNGRMVGDWDYKLEISVHKKVGSAQQPVLCLREMFGQKCVICDDMFEEYRKKGTPEFNKDTAVALQPQWRCVYVVYDYRDEKHQGFKLWDYAYKSFEEYLMTKAENSPEGLVVFSDPFDGRVIEIEGKIKKIGEKFDYIEPGALRFLPRSEPYTEADVTGNFPLDQMLIIPTYDEVTRLHLCMETESEPEPEKEVSQFVARRQPAIVGRQSVITITPICPAQGKMGVDYFRLPLCQNECPEEIFVVCENMAKVTQADPLAPGVDPPSMQKEPPVAVPMASQPAQRRQPVTTSIPASLPVTEAPARRRR